MTAFGPYKNTEVVDFRVLGEHRLFVISGMTGAGKTTIFDGISFALFGAGSGQDRKDIKTLRSDFADDAVHTSAELLFEMHGRTYRVLRQLGHVKQGNKSATGEKYELYEVLANGLEQPVVERMKVREVDKKIEEILGLTQDQFSQIVMLPQGEFRKLLTSETENKEEILRKIFKTDRYVELIKRLDSKRKEAEQQLAQAAAIRKSYINQIAGALPSRQSPLFEVIEQQGVNIHQLLESLQNEERYYQEQVKQQEITYKEAFQLHNVMQEQYIQAKSNNELIENHEKRKAQLTQLELQRPYFEQQRQELEFAERASRIEPFEQQLENLRLELATKTKLLTEAENTLGQAKKNHLAIVSIFEEEKAKSEQRDALGVRITQLFSLIPVFKELEEVVHHVEQLSKEVNSAEALFTQKRQQREKSSNILKIIMSAIEEAEEKLVSFDESSVKLDRLREQMKTLKEFQKHIPIVQQLEQQLTVVQAEKVQTEQYVKNEEQKWIAGQASALAKQLVEGEPCPVCGSTVHERPHLSQYQPFDEQQLEQLKQKVQQADQKLMKVYGEHTAAKRYEERLIHLLNTLGTSYDQFEAVQRDYMEIGQAVQNMKKIKEQVTANRVAWKNEQQKLDVLQQQLTAMEQAYQQKKEQLVTQNTILVEKRKLLSSQFESLQQLEETIRLTQSQKLQLDNRWEQAQKNIQQASEALAKAELHVTHYQSVCAEVTEKLTKAQELFNKQLVAAQFHSFEVYKQAKRTESQRTQLQEAYTHFIHTLHVLQSTVQEDTVKLKGIEWEDLEGTEHKLTALKNEYEQAYRILNQFTDAEKICRDFYDKLVIAEEQITQLENKATAILELFNVLRGQNERKISFERYVQIGYLEQITHAANRRLKFMSDGQYSLHCSERQESHGRQSGLSLDVFDEFTGQMRDVKTLSGGEKFNASLCLALGMADVIQSFQGNIRIDTMFIDEGFGSLDQETLIKAIDTLIDLQKSGRMIGVISHVEELKSAIPAILEVRKEKEGYSKTKFTFK